MKMDFHKIVDKNILEFIGFLLLNETKMVFFETMVKSSLKSKRSVCFVPGLNWELIEIDFQKCSMRIF